MKSIRDGWFFSFVKKHPKFKIPISLYPDKYSVFFPPKKVNDHITIEEQLNGREKGITQFGRIVEDLGITMFAASSEK